MAAVVILFAIGIWIGMGLLGGWIASERGHSWLLGFLLGILLNGIGLIVAALLPRTIENQAMQALAVDRAIGLADQPSRPLASGAPLLILNKSLPGSSQLTSSLETVYWKDVEEAAKSLPEEQSPSAIATVRHLSSKMGLRAWTFGQDSGANSSLVLLFDDEMMR